MARMLSASRPSASSSRTAVSTMASRLMGSRRRRAGRSGSRCQGGGGTAAVPAPAALAPAAGVSIAVGVSVAGSVLTLNTVPVSNTV